jgi:hypothetical protein
MSGLLSTQLFYQIHYLSINAAICPGLLTQLRLHVFDKVCFHMQRCTETAFSVDFILHNQQHIAKSYHLSKLHHDKAFLNKQRALRTTHKICYPTDLMLYQVMEVYNLR